MMLHQLHLCFLLAILLLVCPKTGKANGYEEKEVDAPTKWIKCFAYDNWNSENVVREITATKGMRNLLKNSRTLTATHSVGGTLKAGDKYKIVSLEVSYSFKHEKSETTLTENEIYESKTIKYTVTIPPKSTFTRWQLVVDVAGMQFEYMHYIDVLNDTQNIPHTNTSRVKIQVGRQIHYNETRIRIKHLERNEYLTVIENKKWPAATLGYASNFLFILHQDSLGIRIKTLYTMHPGYEWAYASIYGGVYFDLHRKMGVASKADVNKQYWIISQEEPLRHGDVVTFRNKFCNVCSLAYRSSRRTSVSCVKKQEDKWILEVV